MLELYLAQVMAINVCSFFLLTWFEKQPVDRSCFSFIRVEPDAGVHNLALLLVGCPASCCCICMVLMSIKYVNQIYFPADITNKRKWK
jgi:hypothetical protein